MASLSGYAPGDYMNTCFECGTQFTGGKRAIQCFDCAVKALEARLASQERALEVAVGALKEIEELTDCISDSDAGLRVAILSYEALTQIEGEGEK